MTEAAPDFRWAGDVAGEPMARLLAELHRAPVDRAEGASRPPDRLAAALAALRMVGLVHPPPAPAAEDLGARVCRQLPEPGPVALIHGDLHADQIVLAPERPVLVDLDRAAVGHPLADVGGLLAHLHVLGLQWPERRASLDRFAEGFVEAYVGSSPTSVRRGLGFTIGCAVAEQSLLSFRTLRPGWRNTIDTVLDPAAVAALAARWAP